MARPAAETLGVRPFAEIARGPVAAVFKAYDAEAGAVVLLKTLRPGAAADPERCARFAAEARLAAEVDHPNVVRVIRVAPDGSALVAEWVEGRDLQAVLDDRGALPAGLAALVMREAARGLAAVHAAGIVHRDVKAANVLLGDDGSVRLTDFGLASLVPDAAGPEVRGTLATLAPEIVRGDAARPAADVFSLGVVLAHALTGRAPFDAATPSDTLDAVLHTDIGATLAADPRVPPALAALAAQALHRDPAARPTADAFAQGLDALLPPEAGPTTLANALAGTAADAPRLLAPAAPPRAPDRAIASSPSPARRRAPWILSGLAAAVLVVVLVALRLQPAGPGVPPTEPAALDPVAIGEAPRASADETDKVGGASETASDLAALPSAAPEELPAAPSAERPALDRPPDLPPSSRPPAAPGAALSTAPPESSDAPAPNDDARPGTLVAAAEPWATVRVDGRAVGTTPVQTSLPPGTYALTFENPGFPTHTRTVRIEPGATARADVSLWTLVARVTLDVAPWAEVWVDGTLWDTVPPQARPLVLRPGSHVLRFEHPTLGRRERTLVVAAGETRTVRIRMTDPAP